MGACQVSSKYTGMNFKKISLRKQAWTHGIQLNSFPGAQIFSFKFTANVNSYFKSDSMIHADMAVSGLNNHRESNENFKRSLFLI